MNISIATATIKKKELFVVDEEMKIDKSAEKKGKHPKCDKCGSDTFCRHSVGSSGCDTVDDFRLICPKCGEIDKWCHVDMGNDAETCPWCGKLV